MITYAHEHIHAHTCKVSHVLPSSPFSVFSPSLHSSLLPKDKRSRVSTSGGVRGGERSPPADLGLLLVQLLWIQPYIHIGSLTLWPIAPWHTSWCQTARNSRLQDTVYNNSTHLYWINGLKWTDQFSMLCIVGVSLCFLSFLSSQKD